jgi:hypothetical protein
MAGRHLRNGSITVVRDRTGGRESNKVDKIRSLDNTTVSQEEETEGTVVIAEFECSNSDGTVTTDVSVGVSTRQLQDLLADVITTVRTDIVTVMETNNSSFEAEYSNLTLNFVTIAERLDSKLQAAIENITAKILQENDKLLGN